MTTPAPSPITSPAAGSRRRKNLDEGLPNPAADLVGKPIAYEGTAQWLRDLARGLHARLSWSRRLSELQTGIGRTGGKSGLSLTDVQLGALARGELLRRGDHQWTIATIATNGELPIEQWAALAERCVAWRLARTAASAPDHPSRNFQAIADRLPPLLAAGAELLLLRELRDSIEPLLERCQIDADGPLTVRDLFRLLGDAESDWLREDAQTLFATDGPLYALGVCEPIRAEWLPLPLLDRALIIDPVFSADCLGKGLHAITSLPGVSLHLPIERLDDVVLTPAQRQIVAGIPLLWPWITGRTHALGVLFHGPSGTGKSMLAKALAGSAGRPLLMYRPPEEMVHRHQRNPQIHNVLPGLLHHAVREQAILFIDEADDVLPADSSFSRTLLTHMETSPLVLMLATNQPLRFDPALDRRLLVKMELGMPGPVERAAILRRELRCHAPATTAAFLEDPALDRLAESRRLTGGYWRNAVEIAGMIATQRAGGATTITVDDLVAATRQQDRDDSRLFNANAQHIRWIEPLRPLGSRPLDAVREEGFRRLLIALEGGRVDRAAVGRPGIGLVITATGQDTGLVELAAEGLAHGLRLPLAWVNEPPPIQFTGRRHSPHDSEGGGLLSDSVEEGMEDRTSFVASLNRLARDPDDQRSHGAERQRGNLPAARHLLASLGEQAVVGIVCKSSDLNEWLPIIDLLAVSAHLTILHWVDGPVPASLVRRSALCSSWGVVDDHLRQAQWLALGGVGAAPPARTMSELHASVARATLRRFGVAGTSTAESLP